MKKGRVWKYGDNVNTDVIFPGKYTYSILEPEDMARHALEDIDPGFAQKVKPGDVIVAGRNFGCGSSREHAVICLMENKVGCVVAESFARIFYRNAINSGFPLLECPGILKKVKTKDELEIDLETGEIKNLTNGETIQGHPLSGLESEITEAGGLLNYLKNKT